MNIIKKDGYCGSCGAEITEWQYDAGKYIRTCEECGKFNSTNDPSKRTRRVKKYKIDCGNKSIQIIVTENFSPLGKDVTPWSGTEL